MSCILNIETSTSVCSVAISEDGMVPFVEEDLKGPSHAVSLGVFVDEALDSGSGFRWRRESVTDATFR